MRPGAAALVRASIHRRSAQQHRQNRSPKPAERLTLSGRKHGIHSKYSKGWLKNPQGEQDLRSKDPEKVKNKNKKCPSEEILKKEKKKINQGMWMKWKKKFHQSFSEVTRSVGVSLKRSFAIEGGVKNCNLRKMLDFFLDATKF